MYNYRRLLIISWPGYTINDLPLSIIKMHITFRTLDFSDIPLMYKWFNFPHVQKYYSLRCWSEKEVLNKLQPYILGTQPVSGFIILFNESPIGYLQSYAVKNYPWPDQNISQEIIDHAAGIDLFIGTSDLIGHGWGRIIIQTFLQNNIWPEYKYCIVDPEVTNEAAIRCYESLQFKEHAIIETTDAMNQPTSLKLMILTKSIATDETSDSSSRLKLEPE